jgi:hypothetical protein
VILRERDGWLQPARRALGDESVARAQAEGQAMTLEEAIACALREDSQATPAEPLPHLGHLLAKSEWKS